MKPEGMVNWHPVTESFGTLWEVQVVDLLVNVGKYTVRPMDASFVFGKLAFPVLFFPFFLTSERTNNQGGNDWNIPRMSFVRRSFWADFWWGLFYVFVNLLLVVGFLNRKHLDIVCLRALNMMGWFIHLFFCPSFFNFLPPVWIGCWCFFSSKFLVEKRWSKQQDTAKEVCFTPETWESESNQLVRFNRSIWVFPKIGVPPKWMVYNGTPY